MSNLSKIFDKRKALIVYITAGDPSLSATEKLVYDFEKAGADIIELGIPFSDPLADGPVIQASHARALKRDVTLNDAFSLVKKLRKKTQIPLVFMLTDNLIEKYGAEKFFSDCGEYGVNGVICPDLPPEEMADSPSTSLGASGKQTAVSRIFLVAPTSTDERIKKIAGASTGFIYLVSLMGVTGKRATLSEEVSSMVSRIKKYTKKPVAVGFGISTPAQAKEAARSADGVIIGSAIVDLIARKKTKEAVKLVSQVRRSIDSETRD